MFCRHCQRELKQIFCDLHTCPPSNAMLHESDLFTSEKYFPLMVFVCENCWLVQVEELEKAEDIFDSDYTYFSSYSKTWLLHAKQYADLMHERFTLSNNSLVMEIASNDGYLLQYFNEKGIPVVGIEPSANTAEVAIKKGINTIIDFFGSEFARKNFQGKADLIVGNNVLAHVPDINDFVSGVKVALKLNGVSTFEFPHILSLINQNQFDTIYHEHFSYLSLISVKKIFEAWGLEIFDVEELSTHGGSLRIYAQHSACGRRIENSVHEVLQKEYDFGLATLAPYMGFQTRIEKIKYEFLDFLLNTKKQNKVVVGYGAAAKGNTLLNFAGVKGTDLIKFVVDASPHKQDRFLPGSRIPVVAETELMQSKPDYIIIFPWNLTEEIMDQLSYVDEWGAKFVRFIPKFEKLN